MNRERDYWRNLPRTRPSSIETPGPGQESVWDFPRPPRVEICGKRIRVRFAGVEIAASHTALRVVETAGAPVYYFAPAEVATSFLRPARDGATSLCEWKGIAHYWDLRVGPRMFSSVAWSYPTPEPAYRDLRGRFAFFAGRGGEAWVGEERATPQPGGFYGGWVTEDLVGPFKGEAGTERW